MLQIKQNLFEKWLISIIICIEIIWLCTLTIPGEPFGSDIWNFHKFIIADFAEGKNGMFRPDVVNSQGPYPPLFHILMVPAYLSGNFNGIVLMLQMLLMPLVTGVISIFVWRFFGPRNAVIVTLLLFLSMGFRDRTSQVIPHTIDMILMPLIMYSILKAKNKIYAGSTSAMIYNHGLYGFVFLAGTSLFLVFKRRKMLRVLPLILLVTSPMILITVTYWNNYMSVPIPPQTIYAWTNPFFDVEYLGFYTILGLILFVTSRMTPRLKNDQEKLVMLWVLIALIPAINQLDRAIAIASVPAAILASIGFNESWSKWKGLWRR